MTTHWRTIHRDDPCLRPPLVGEEIAASPFGCQRAPVEAEPAPQPGRAYGLPSGTRHIDVPLLHEP